ncbi:hypothetical protein [Syntrophomonas erecta]
MDQQALLSLINTALANKKKACSLYEQYQQHTNNHHVQDIIDKMLGSEKQHLDTLESIAKNMVAGHENDDGPVSGKTAGTNHIIDEAISKYIIEELQLKANLNGQ